MTSAAKKFITRNYPAIVVTLISLGLVAITLVMSRRVVDRIVLNHTTKDVFFALQNYHDVYGRFSSAKYTDESGNVHSWRSRVFRDGYPTDAYSFSDPWDSPNNRRAASEHPDARRAGRLGYSVLAVVGETSAWAPAGTRRRQDFTDGISETILIMVVKNAGVKWFEPRDLLFDGKRLRIEGQGDAEVDLVDCFVGMADGSIEMLSDETAKTRLNAMLTHASDDAVPTD